jgi:hypothetical protein
MLDLDKFQSQNLMTDTTMKVEYIISLVATKVGV